MTEKKTHSLAEIARKAKAVTSGTKASQTETRTASASLDAAIFDGDLNAFENAQWNLAKKQEHENMALFYAHLKGVKKTSNRPIERRDRLTIAIEAALVALRSTLKAEPTAGDVFHYLAERDETGIVQDWKEDMLIWETSEGKSKSTSRKALENRLSKIRRKNPA